ncbi:MAG TPA: SIMPL domain-containing protein [Bryobacteraceae bacterium]|jgi:hypothetical protein
MINRFASFGALLFACVPLLAQKVSIDAAMHTSDKSYILDTGEATVSVKPDQAVIDIGVVAQGSKVASVAAQNAKQTDAVLADLRRILGPNDRFKTISYSVRPAYQAGKIDGYTATNVVEVVLHDLDQMGKVIDAVLQPGANSIQKLDFGLKNPQAARSQALEEAAVQAKASAEASADGLGVHVVRVLSAEEYEPDGDFVKAKRATPARAGAKGTPQTEIGSSTIEVSVTVMLRAEIAP